MITLSPTALATIADEVASCRGPDETGGILLGHDHGSTILVTLAGDPGPLARRSPTRFRRDLAHAQRLGDAAYALDGSVWIGDWHTHPSTVPRLSRYDLGTYRSFLRDPELDLQRFVALIVTPPADFDSGTRLTAWLVSRRRGRLPGLAVVGIAVDAVTSRGDATP